ncbi:unnamed protein product [Ceutorhynchus assimilis]|uniref:Uncharacterized protein n=1 Tax=Ceutorhynchus assimilis TaxID=467358 RepID=A0A9P0GPP8_9CUCU|nr:unnamed protein product [Ceutorhynchus assimilis]
MYEKLRKLKLPVKAFQALILIMVILKQCSSLSHSHMRCFGPVSKTKVYNHDNGYVYVSNSSRHQIMISGDIEYGLYQISTPLNPTWNVKYRHHGHRMEEEPPHSFYLFDPRTRRFLCWKNVNGSMISMDYKNIEQKKHWDLCKFIDRVSDDKRFLGAYVTLQLEGHRGTTMQFDKKGRNISHKRIQKCIRKLSRESDDIRVRQIKRCMGRKLYLFKYPPEKSHDCCSEAFETLCKGKTRHMPELKDACRKARSCAGYP